MAKAIIAQSRKDSIPKRQYIPLSTLREIWAQPCAVCGSDFETRVDHIVPVACGGSSDRSNLQSLCWQCNHIKKGSPMTNEQIAAVVCRRGVDHWLKAHYRKFVQYQHGYDRIDYLSYRSRALSVFGGAA